MDSRISRVKPKQFLCMLTFRVILLPIKPFIRLLNLTDRQDLSIHHLSILNVGRTKRSVSDFLIDKWQNNLIINFRRVFVSRQLKIRR